LLEAIGVTLAVIGGCMILPSVLLHRSFGHLVAPRPIVLVLVFSGMLIVGALMILGAKLFG
jgi:hypothetical protein